MIGSEEEGHIEAVRRRAEAEAAAKAAERAKAEAARAGQRRAGDFSYLDDLSMDDLTRDDIAFARDQALRDRWLEDHRKGRVDSGSNMINAYFDGGAYGKDQVKWEDLPFAFNANQTNFAPIFSPEDNPLSPEQSANLANALRRVVGRPRTASVEQVLTDRAQGVPGGQEFLDWAMNRQTPFYDAQGNQVTDLQKIMELGPQGQLFSGRGQADSPFNEDFYNKQRQAYTDWAQPQLQQQHRDASRELAFALSRMGHSGGSTTMVGRHDRLQSDNAKAAQDMARQADNMAKQAKTQIHNEKTDLLNMNQAAADPSQMASMIPGAIQNLQSPQQQFSPLGPVFQNVTAGLGQYMNGKQLGPYMQQGQGPPIYQPPVSGGSGKNYG